MRKKNSEEWRLSKHIGKERNAYKEREKAVQKNNNRLVKEKQQAIKEKLGAEAKEKLKKGEKLSWNEFQLALGDDPEEDSEKYKN
jgi:uncharacterized coiled-coil DUF342 family protein